MRLSDLKSVGCVKVGFNDVSLSISSSTLLMALYHVMSYMCVEDQNELNLSYPWYSENVVTFVMLLRCTVFSVVLVPKQCECFFVSHLPRMSVFVFSDRF